MCTTQIVKNSTSLLFIAILWVYGDGITWFKQT